MESDAGVGPAGNPAPAGRRGGIPVCRSRHDGCGAPLQPVLRRGRFAPALGLGFWHRVPTLYRDEEVEREAMEFRARDIPCDVIGLEPGWQSASYPCTYEWGADRFPDPAGFVSRMRQAGFRLNLWEHPYISPRSELYGEMQALSGDYAVWGGLAPDFALEKARSCTPPSMNGSMSASA
ncbi:TIM-barrel domain-containing protein [Paenibacillus sp. JTLBN-2024]